MKLGTSIRNALFVEIFLCIKFQDPIFNDISVHFALEICKVIMNEVNSIDFLKQNLTNQTNHTYKHVSAVVSSHHQVNSKTINQEKLQLQYWSEISDLTNVLHKIHNVHHM